jgi:outer membrane protein assembly factor BamA
LLNVSKKINKKEIYLGLQYVFSRTKVKSRFSDSLPAFVDKAKEVDSKTGSLGVFLDWDKRNTIFTPDKGVRVNLSYSVNAEWTASDYNYQRTDAWINWFTSVKKNWISGLRAEVQHVFDDPPFYLLPYLSLRGVPAARYQGDSTVLLETEQRFDMNLQK